MGSAWGLLLAGRCPGADRGLQGTHKGGFLPWGPCGLGQWESRARALSLDSGPIPSLAGPDVLTCRMEGWRDAGLEESASPFPCRSLPRSQAVNFTLH